MSTKKERKERIEPGMYQRRGEDGKKKIWWLRFRFAGRMIHESTHTMSVTVARDALRERRRKLELSINGLKERRALAPTFKVAAKRWQDNRAHTTAGKTQDIADNALKQLLPVFGSKLLTDIEPQHIIDYQQSRLRAKAAGRTVNIEIGLLRQALKTNDLWLPLAGKFKMLAENKDVGRALTKEEQSALLKSTSEPRYSDSPLYPIVVTALNTGMRSNEIKTLRWSQVDLFQKTIRVGKSKTAAGTNRVIQLNQSAFTVLARWASRTPEASPEHFVFPACENHKVDPVRPVTSVRTAWRNAAVAAGIKGLRFHDLRHTTATNLLEIGTPFATVAEIMGWSPAMAVRMIKHYAHIRPVAQRQALDAIATELVGVHQNVHQVPEDENVPSSKLLI